MSCRWLICLTVSAGAVSPWDVDMLDGGRRGNMFLTTPLYYCIIVLVTDYLPGYALATGKCYHGIRVLWGGNLHDNAWESGIIWMYRILHYSIMIIYKNIIMVWMAFINISVWSLNGSLNWIKQECSRIWDGIGIRNRKCTPGILQSN